MSIQISQMRVCGFRGLNNIEVDLERVTVLTGMNNTGKTTFLKALQIALGNKMFISQDDFFIADKETSNQIIVDLKIIPIDATGKHVQTFDADWEILFTEERIRTNLEGYSCIPLRTVVNFDPLTNSFKTKHYILKEWPEFESNGAKWQDVDNGTEKAFVIEEIPFFTLTLNAILSRTLSSEPLISEGCSQKSSIRTKTSKESRSRSKS